MFDYTCALYGTYLFLKKKKTIQMEESEVPKKKRISCSLVWISNTCRHLIAPHEAASITWYNFNPFICDKKIKWRVFSSFVTYLCKLVIGFSRLWMKYRVVEVKKKSFRPLPSKVGMVEDRVQVRNRHCFVTTLYGKECKFCFECLICGKNLKDCRPQL